jgi:hypothetical protein
MSLTVKINIKDDKGKEVELELKEADNLSKLVIIQNVFNLFGIDKDIFEMVKTFEQVGRAYSSFFENLNPIENATKEEIVLKSEEIKQSLIEGLQNTEELKEVYQTTDDQPEWIRTGIKVDPDGRKRYRCRYHCVICNYRANHYIYENSTEIKCHSCGMAMPVSPAHPDGFPNADTHNNFFRAGDYFDWKLV